MAKEQTSLQGPDVDKVALAVLALLVDEREARVAHVPEAIPTDALLDQAGLNSAQIGALLHKTPGAVRTTLSRRRGASKGSAPKK